MSLSAAARSRLTLRRAAPLHATCTESLPLFRASGGDKSVALLSLTLFSPTTLKATLYVSQ